MDFEEECIAPWAVINNIYDAEGFLGVIDYLMSELHIGHIIEKEEGLYCITTGGWSDDEDLIHECLHMLCKFGKHYRGYTVGGAYYFTENHDCEIEIRIKHDCSAVGDCNNE